LSDYALFISGPFIPDSRESVYRRMANILKGEVFVSTENISNRCCYLSVLLQFVKVKKKEEEESKFISVTAVEAHRVVRRRGSNIF
jgi:hypothetical protein